MARQSLIQRAADWGIRTLSRFAPEREPPFPGQPQRGRFYSGARDDHSIDTNLRQLTPAKLGSAMKDAEEGDTDAQYEVFEMVEQDGHIASVWNKRRRAVTSKTLQISPAIGDESAEGKRAAQAAELCQEVIFGRWGGGGIPNWHVALKDLTDAIGKGFALTQIVWELDGGNEGGRWLPASLERWPQRECHLGNPTELYAQDKDEVRVITDAEMYEGQPLGTWQWICHVQKNWSVTLAKASLFRGAVWYYLFKRFGWRDWAIFAERYGMPLRAGKYHPGATGPEKEALWEAVYKLGKDSACIIPDQSTIELIEAKGSAGGVTLPYPELIKHCNAELSKLFLGNPMTTDPGEKGARSLGEVYERSEAEMTEDDCDNLARTLRRDLLTPLVGFNLGWDAPVPKVSFLSDESEDLEARARTDKILAKELGLPMAKSYFYDAYDRPEPEEGEDLLETPRQQGPIPPGKGDDGEQEGDEEDAKANAELAKEIIRLARSKKKSVNWVISKMLSREPSSAD